MNLATALHTAQSALAARSNETAIVSRNIAGAGDPNYTTKSALVGTWGDGVRVLGIERAANLALFDTMLNSSAANAGEGAIVDALNRLRSASGGGEYQNSPALGISRLADALQLSASNPQDMALAANAVAGADDLAGNLRRLSGEVQSVRSDADASIGASVDRLNNLLQRFEEVNTRIIELSRTGMDATDLMDSRDEILRGISQETGISTVRRENNDLAVYTDSGVTLFETSARSVTFQASGVMTAGQSGNAVHIDGVPVAGPGATMALGSGRIQGLMSVRDDLAVTYQTQLDEIARGLIEAFAEQDQGTPSTLADQPGLFTYDGAAGVPATGTMIAGLAGLIKINDNVNPALSGSPALLRDGGISDPGNTAFTYNTTAAAGYSDRLEQLVDGLSSSRLFDGAAKVEANASVRDFASNSIGWLEARRQSASVAADFEQALFSRTSQSLIAETGVNLDEEMTKLIELEQSYQASSRLIAVVDKMFDTLLASVR